MITLDDKVERMRARHAINELISHCNWLGEPMPSLGLLILQRAKQHLLWESSVALWWKGQND
jgi:hypothetical protein